MKKQTMAEALKRGDFVAIAKEDTEKAGLVPRVVMPKCDIGLTAKNMKAMSAMLAGVCSCVAWCKLNKVSSASAVSFKVNGFPPLALSCVPMDPPKDFSPVLVVAVELKGGQKK